MRIKDILLVRPNLKFCDNLPTDFDKEPAFLKNT